MADLLGGGGDDVMHESSLTNPRSAATNRVPRVPQGPGSPVHKQWIVGNKTTRSLNSFLGLSFLSVFVIVPASFNGALAQDGGGICGTCGESRGVRARQQSGLGPSPFFNHQGPGADFDKTGASTRIFGAPPGEMEIPPAPAAEPYTLTGPALPAGAVEIRTFLSWNWLLNGAPPAVSGITVTNAINPGGLAVAGGLIGMGTPGPCWGKGWAASYIADVTGNVVLGGPNTIAGSTDMPLGPDPNAYGEGLTILLVYENPGDDLRNVDVYAGYTSTESGPVVGTASAVLNFSVDYTGGDLHFFVNGPDGQIIAYIGEPVVVPDDFFINGVNASGIAGLGGAGNAWAGLLHAAPPAPVPGPANWLYDHANDDIAAFVDAPAGMMAIDTVRPEVGDCVGHSLAAVSFRLECPIPQPYPQEYHG